MKERSPTIYTNTEVAQWQQLVADTRLRLAELEVEYTKAKSRVDAVQATLYRQLHEHYQERDQLRLKLDYRKKLLETLTRCDLAAAQQATQNFEQAKTQTDRDYDEMTQAMERKRQLTAQEEAELTRLWKKLVKLYHPDLFIKEPEKLETYNKLTSAINRAKDTGDIETLREIAEDPRSFVVRQGWARLDFKDIEELAQLKRLYEALQKEVAAVTESLNGLRESSDYELCLLAEQKPDALDELAAERAEQLEGENAELELQLAELAQKIQRLGESDS